MIYNRKLASVLSISGLFFFALGFILFPNATAMFSGVPANPFVVLGFVLLGIGLLQPLFEKMRGKKK